MKIDNDIMVLYIMKYSDLFEVGGNITKIEYLRAIYDGNCNISYRENNLMISVEWNKDGNRIHHMENIERLKYEHFRDMIRFKKINNILNRIGCK